jgi:hypothetical protein
LEFESFVDGAKSSLKDVYSWQPPDLRMIKYVHIVGANIPTQLAANPIV